MAPGLITPPAEQQHNPIESKKTVPLDVFPDGIKTSGQHPPLYDQLRPFEDFPDEITGPTVWHAEDYKHNPERWTHQFSEDEIAELSAAADQFKESGTPLTGISKVSLPLSNPSFEPGLTPQPGQFSPSTYVLLPQFHSKRAPQ